MNSRLLLLVFFLSLVVVDASRRRHSRHKKHEHRIFVAPPQRFSKNFLQVYALKSLEEFNKQNPDPNKYALLGIVDARASEENKALEIMLKFGRTRCQKTEDRYFCQTAEDIVGPPRIFKVSIRRQAEDNKVEFEFQESKSESLAANDPPTTSTTAAPKKK
ncbi:hypothetical protein M3Y99_01026700 [Aphelenchoides fujianensis]|nr:hypothetical protein M3Y99_01026700 [Aphelenchoides fujianensis]